jgi:hypothetical protein
MNIDSQVEVTGENNEEVKLYKCTDGSCVLAYKDLSTKKNKTESKQVIDTDIGQIELETKTKAEPEAEPKTEP